MNKQEFLDNIKDFLELKNYQETVICENFENFNITGYIDDSGFGVFEYKENTLLFGLMRKTFRTSISITFDESYIEIGNNFGKRLSSFKNKKNSQIKDNILLFLSQQTNLQDVIIFGDIYKQGSYLLLKNLSILFAESEKMESLNLEEIKDMLFSDSCMDLVKNKIRFSKEIHFQYDNMHKLLEDVYYLNKNNKHKKIVIDFYGKINKFLINALKEWKIDINFKNICLKI